MTATDTEAALLAAVRANPGDIARRMVYADALADAGSELEAIMQRIIATPGDDGLRLAYAAELERTAGAVACDGCNGCGKIGIGNNGNPYMATCRECHGTGRVSDGRKEWSEFIRVQLELQQYAHASQLSIRTHPRWDWLGIRKHELWPAVRGAFAGDGVVCDITSGAQHAGATLIIQRGLPAVVRCTIAEWMGGECATCGGEGDVSASDATRERTGAYTVACPTCRGTGRTPGIGPRLAQRWPVVEVEVTDKRPLGTNAYGGIRWTNEGHFSWGLPKEVFERLPTGPTCTMIRDAGESWASRISARDYDSEPAARAAASDAMLAWARGQVIDAIPETARAI